MRAAAVPNLKVASRAELDSNCDTCCFGQGVYVAEDTLKTISVNGFMEDLGTLPNVKIIAAAIAYDGPEAWHTYILFYHQALYIPTMQKHLLNPNQMRANDVIVNKTPLVLLPYDLRNRHSHSTVTTTELHEELHIPLQLEGVTSFFTTRMPTRAEVEDTDNQECTHVHMTPTSGWDPHDTTMANHEASLRAAMNNEDSYTRRQIVQAVATEIDNKQKITREVEATQREAKGTPTMCSPPKLMHWATKPQSTPQATQISHIRRQQENFLCIDIDSYAEELEQTNSSVGTDKRKWHIGPEELASRWGIGLETARKTVDKTTQLAARNFTESMGGRRLRPIHHQLKYRRLRYEMFVDVYMDKCKSLRGNRCATVYCTPFHWIRFDPTPEERDAHKTLDSLFQTAGIPSALIPDNAKSLTEGEFRRKAARASCPIYPVEPHTSNASLCEDGIRETLRGFRRMMSATNTPRVLWDDGLQHYLLSSDMPHTQYHP